MKLYARNIKQQVVEWRIRVVTKDDVVRIETTFGIIGHTNQPLLSAPIKGKNIGKSNATTDKQQAVDEMLSTIERKRKKGYKSLSDLGVPDIVPTHNSDYFYTTLDKVLPKYNTDVNECVKPMKCQPFQDNKFTYPAIAQPKINGVRSVVMYETTKNGLFSSASAVIKSKEGLIYVVKQVTDWFNENIYSVEDNKTLVFDGELYLIGEAVTSIGGAARNVKNPLNAKLQFICFDLSVEDILQHERLKITLDVFSEYLETVQPYAKAHARMAKFPVIRLCDHLVISDKEAREYAKECIELGYEGCVVRNPYVDYKFGQRPMSMMKIKQYTIANFKIIDIIPFDDEEMFVTEDIKVGRGCKFVLQNDLTDDTFICNPMGSYEKRMHYLDRKDRYIGKLAQVKFYERTINNLPFHANVVKVI